MNLIYFSRDLARRLSIKANRFKKSLVTLNLQVRKHTSKSPTAIFEKKRVFKFSKKFYLLGATSRISKADIAYVDSTSTRHHRHVKVLRLTLSISQFQQFSKNMDASEKEAYIYERGHNSKQTRVLSVPATSRESLSCWLCRRTKPNSLFKSATLCGSPFKIFMKKSQCLSSHEMNKKFCQSNPRMKAAVPSLQCAHLQRAYPPARADRGLSWFSRSSRSKLVYVCRCARQFIGFRYLCDLLRR